jgi:hypothetical protein
MVGDVVFFRKTNSFVSRIIAYVSKSEYTHVGLIVNHDEVTGITTIIEVDRFVKTKESKIQLSNDHILYSIPVKSDEMISRILEYAYRNIGTKYDYIQIFGLALSLLFNGERHPIFNSANKLICSELIDLSYYKAGVERKNTLNIGNVTPQELLGVYELKEVTKGK